MTVISITPEQFDPDVHRLPTAGELLLPGMQVCIRANGIAYPQATPIIDTDIYGTVIELSKRGEVVEVALTGDKQEDGGFFFEQFWVVVE